MVPGLWLVGQVSKTWASPPQFFCTWGSGIMFSPLCWLPEVPSWTCSLCYKCTRPQSHEFHDLGILFNCCEKAPWPRQLFNWGDCLEFLRLIIVGPWRQVGRQAWWQCSSWELTQPESCRQRVELGQAWACASSKPTCSNTSLLWNRILVNLVQIRCICLCCRIIAQLWKDKFHLFN